MNACNSSWEGSPSGFVGLLRQRAGQQPDRWALSFLIDGEKVEVRRTYSELDREARAIAAHLQRLGQAGQAVLLLYPPGLEFVSAFLGCLYAGAVAAPTHPPHSRRALRRLETIAADAAPAALLTSARLLPELKAACPRDSLLANAHWSNTDDIDLAMAQQWRPPDWTPHAPACLQYTSGSTSDPKGVVLTHSNLLSNSQLIREAFGHEPSSVGVIWLPPYHDMGLIGGVLQPLFGGFPVVLMSPAHVMQRPLRWLAALSRFRATTSGGPNFIYDLCVEKISAAEAASLDLSHWTVAFNGSEPVREETLTRFSRKFAPCGFRHEAFLPCYGLAEATLYVSGGPKSRPPSTRSIDKAALEKRRAANRQLQSPGQVHVVGCGQPASGHEVLIVAPESRVPCAPGEIGEIWVAGPSVAHGYWNRPEQTSETFAARLAEANGRSYLRTGDLGFLSDGELFVAGRLKDLLIIDGCNHYPQDIELTVERCHPALVRHSGAAFAVDENGQRLVVAQEIERNGRQADLPEVFSSIRQAVSEEHDLAVHAIVLVKIGGIPKTTSGKIQRGSCRELFLSGRLQLVARWDSDDRLPSHRSTEDLAPARTAATPAPPGPNGERPRSQSAEAVQQWLIDRLSRRLRCPASDIDVRQPFACYGLKSREAVELSGELEQWLGRRLSPTLTYDYPTIESLALHLAGHPNRAAADCAGDDPETSAEPIAIVGLGCRLPGAQDPDAFWRLLAEGADAITEVPADRWDADAIDKQVSFIGASNVPGSVRWGGWLSNIDRFDAPFFGISPREAACIDPQQRILLEIAWEAFEDSGHSAARLRGSRTGVFVGISTNDYRRNFMSRTCELDPYWSTGNASSIAANRLSYFFDLKGPSLAVDTACSSSLVAVHWACQSLRHGECNLALAGGVNVILSPDISYSFVKGGGLAPDGRCKAFDAHADGIVRSEGAGLVVLKRLSKALADQDHIYAVIRGGAVNQDGRSNGITAPNQASQQAVVRDAWRSAGVTPGEAQYVETHGAGTLLGDVIEANGLQAVLSHARPAGQRCAIGSVKTNIGHCEAAAGIASLIKVALAIQHGQIPPSLHFLQPNPHIPFDETPLFVQTRLSDWPARQGRRLAGVSSFGFGGTNAHLVLESPPPGAPETASANCETGDPILLPLSAASRPALQALAARFEESTRQRGAPATADLADLAYAAATKRTHLGHRATLLFRNATQLREQLAALQAGQGHPAVAAGQSPASGRPKLVFVFSGHGSQWPGMHRILMNRFPAFRTKIEQCDALLRRHVDWSLLAELDADTDDSARLHAGMEIAQLRLFAFQVAMTEAWKSWNISPDAVVGHSMGEVAAAHAAGILDLPDAIRVILHRSRALQHALDQLPASGGMAALRISAGQAQELIRQYQDRVWIAVHNSPKYTVLSGDRAALEHIIKTLRKQKIGGRMMNVPGAGHTPQLEPTRVRLQAALQGLFPKPASVPFYSTVTGEQLDGGKLDAQYWGDNVRQPVQFAPAIERLSQDGYHAFLEVSPHPMLTAAVVQCLEHRGDHGVVLPSLRRDDGDLAAMLGSFGALHANGFDVDWRCPYPRQRKWVPLPSYPWQRQRCWIDPEPRAEAASEDSEPPRPGSDQRLGHAWLGRKIDLAAAPQLHCWETRLSTRQHPFLLEFPCDDEIALPLAVYLDAAVAAASQVFGVQPCLVDQVRLTNPLRLSRDADSQVQVAMNCERSDGASVQFFSRQPDASGATSWRLHASSRVRANVEDQPPPHLSDHRLEQLPSARNLMSVPTDPRIGRPLDGNGLESYAITRLWRGRDEAFARVSPPEDLIGAAAGFAIHPSRLDACFRVLGEAVPGGAGDDQCSYAATDIAQFRWRASLAADSALWVHAVLDSHPSNPPETIQGGLLAWDDAEQLVFEAYGLRLQRLSPPQRNLVEARSRQQRPPSRCLSPDPKPLEALRSAPPRDRKQKLQEYLSAHIAHALGADANDIDVQQPLTNLGIDSLMAMEVKNRVESELGAEIRMVQLLEGPTIARLADMLLPQLDRCGPNAEEENSQHQRPTCVGQALEEDEASKLLERFDDLSDEDVDALAHRMLSEQGGAP